ncbi:YggT family protein [Verticiella sediminum]|uniref:YggT family protein n=1 Tax=Verticiella sediminum TaxID=1247510 RepID=A0A556A7S7_9BURK|nr:YggT family protein [Verticiella sediminum]TSH88948.1 YggT family protein [Verticiella sediminum]
MFGDILRFLLEIGFTLYGAAFILRAWMQAARVHPFNPLTRGIAQATNWLVIPLRRVVPGFGGVDWASVVGAWLTGLVYTLLLVAASGIGVLAALPVSLGVAALLVLKWTLNLIVWVTLIQAIMSWINPQAPAMGLLYALTAPILDPVRRILPRMGGLDLSPLVVIILAQVALMIVARMSYALLLA